MCVTHESRMIVILIFDILFILAAYKGRCLESSLGKRIRTSTAGVHQLRPFCRHSFIIIIIVVVVVTHLKSFQPQKQRYSAFENNTGQTDRRTDGRTDGHDLL